MMLGTLNQRWCHWLLLIATTAALTLPNIGRFSLWDMDESLNAEAAREMIEANRWVVPTFNFQLRDAKPALLYWGQCVAYRVFGVSEFSARLPSVVAAAFAVLGVYELGRRMFTPATGLLAGLVLMSSFLTCCLAQFANPDALLLACTVATFLAFWIGFAPAAGATEPRRTWFVPVGLACGLAMLAKGPIGLVLPLLVIGAYLIWERKMALLCDRRFLLVPLAAGLVAGPWYVMVTVETRGEFARGFFVRNNLERFLAPMESHRGTILYHPLVLCIGFLPWAVFLAPTIYYAWRNARGHATARTANWGISTRGRAAVRLLVCWFAIYLVFFSTCATKLPNYALPLYPAIALLTAVFLDRWRRGEMHVPGKQFIAVGLSLLVVTGLVVTGGSLLLSGVVSLPIYTLPQNTDLHRWFWIGLIPVFGGLIGLFWLRSDRRNQVIAILSVVSLAFTMAMDYFPATSIEQDKAVPALVADAGTRRRDRDIRLASYQFTQPSLVFYNERDVRPLRNEAQVAEFLAHPFPGYLFIPEPVWADVRGLDSQNAQEIAARHWDLFRRRHILVIRNQAAILALRNNVASE